MNCYRCGLNPDRFAFKELNSGLCRYCEDEIDNHTSTTKNGLYQNKPDGLATQRNQDNMEVSGDSRLV